MTVFPWVGGAARGQLPHSLASKPPLGTPDDERTHRGPRDRAASSAPLRREPPFTGRPGFTFATLSSRSSRKDGRRFKRVGERRRDSLAAPHAVLFLGQRGCCGRVRSGRGSGWRGRGPKGRAMSTGATLIGLDRAAGHGCSARRRGGSLLRHFPTPADRATGRRPPRANLRVTNVPTPDDEAV